MTGHSLSIICACCDKPGLHGGRGLIINCYSKRLRNGTVDEYPSVRHDTEWQKRQAALRAAAAPPALELAAPFDGGDWRSRAACRDEDPELFFPLSYDTRHLEVEEAKNVCRHCPALDDCGAFTRSRPAETRYGIWAGTTPSERASEDAAQLERTSA